MPWAMQGQMAEGYAAFDPLSATGHEIHQLQNQHTHLRPLSPFIEREAVRFTRDSAMFNQENLRFRIAPAGEAYTGLSAYPSPGFASYGAAGTDLLLLAGNRFYFHGNYSYAWMYFPDHLQSETSRMGVIPGMGRAIETGNGFGAHYYTASAGIRLGTYFDLSIGRDKHFWGNGYRSLVLSHNASPYYYGKLTTNIWKIKYVNLWAGLDHLDVIGGAYRRKFMAMHALSWNVSRRVNLTFYEAVVWQARDTLNNRGFEPAYLNPFIFYRPIEYAQGSADNALLGFEVNVKVNEKLSTYAQVYFDEFLLYELQRAEGWWGNKFAIQLGVKSWNLFADSLMLQTEINLAKPFTYTHGSVVQAYGHLNQSLAHPLGTNFIEWVNRARRTRKKGSIEGTIILAAYGRDIDGLNYGGNVFRPYTGPWRFFDNYLLQGQKNTLMFLTGTYAHRLTNDLQLTFSAGARKVFNNTDAPLDGWLMLGIRTPLIAPYRDF